MSIFAKTLSEAGEDDLCNPLLNHLVARVNWRPAPLALEPALVLDDLSESRDFCLDEF